MCCSPRGRKESDATERLSSTKDKARQGFPAGSVVENPPASAGDSGSTPGSGRSPGEGTGNPLQYSSPGAVHAQKNLVGYSPWGHREPDKT